MAVIALWRLGLAEPGPRLLLYAGGPPCFYLLRTKISGVVLGQSFSGALFSQWAGSCTGNPLPEKNVR